MQLPKNALAPTINTTKDLVSTAAARQVIKFMPLVIGIIILKKLGIFSIIEKIFWPKPRPKPEEIDIPNNDRSQEAKNYYNHIKNQFDKIKDNPNSFFEQTPYKSSFASIDLGKLLKETADCLETQRYKKILDNKKHELYTNSINRLVVAYESGCNFYFLNQIDKAKEEFKKAKKVFDITQYIKKDKFLRSYKTDLISNIMLTIFIFNSQWEEAKKWLKILKANQIKYEDYDLSRNTAIILNHLKEAKVNKKTEVAEQLNQILQEATKLYGSQNSELSKQKQIILNQYEYQEMIEDNINKNKNIDLDKIKSNQILRLNLIKKDITEFVLNFSKQTTMEQETKLNKLHQDLQNIKKDLQNPASTKLLDILMLYNEAFVVSNKNNLEKAAECCLSAEKVQTEFFPAINIPRNKKTIPDIKLIRGFIHLDLAYYCAYLKKYDTKKEYIEMAKNEFLRLKEDNAVCSDEVDEYYQMCNDVSLFGDISTKEAYQ